MAIATNTGHIEIWNPMDLNCIAKFRAAINFSLVWTLDGTRLLSRGYGYDPTIREWDTSTWKQVGDPWSGHAEAIYAIAINSTGTLVASASYDKHVRLWRRSDQRTITIFKHSHSVYCVTFSVDDKHIFSGGYENKISEWAVAEDAPKDRAPGSEVSPHLFQRCRHLIFPKDTLPVNASEEQATNKGSSCCFDLNNYSMWRFM
jgi:WD40 repeat protein